MTDPYKPIIAIAAATALSLLGDVTLDTVLPSHYSYIGLPGAHDELLVEAFVCANNDNATLHRAFSSGKLAMKDILNQAPLMRCCYLRISVQRKGKSAGDEPIA